ncbi:hypothetical protein [Paractinoplanes brasiliensis]|uniref:Uncharacterized protein n=1 Tax=Paractinoplanes brasiliensis TaxID=52695 RepID=A0A4R6JS08_9ACTN|nr:hypothetical protein [Actinoplanes brasiliensis]TDO39249.1 hypothetical protein C8E87_2926 [Actinoplanes brasiliensis]GID30048.1 hypothetical protein Abr02nite_50310 [Actinoplanes brasiliensis]
MIQSGLPSYTVPPATGGRSPAATTPFGVVGPEARTTPFGATSPRPSGAEATPAARADDVPAYPPGFDPEPTAAVPRQMQPGTLYGTGGYETIDATMPVSTNAVENSGSLTGHILAQGWHDEVVDRKRSNLKVAIAMLVVLGLLVTVSIVFLLTAGSSFSDWIGGVFS